MKVVELHIQSAYPLFYAVRPLFTQSFCLFTKLVFLFVQRHNLGTNLYEASKALWACHFRA